MTTDYDTLIAHLKRTGRLKLLPRVLRELQQLEAREHQRAPKKETTKENPSLISGWRSLEGGQLTDYSGKGALIEIYRGITNA